MKGKTASKVEEGDHLEVAEAEREVIDLKADQTQDQDDGALDEMDDFDLLEATIDPDDIQTQRKVRQLEHEIELEKQFLNCKRAFKMSFMPDDPFKNSE